jgi:hypothetical protein
MVMVQMGTAENRRAYVKRRAKQPRNQGYYNIHRRGQDLQNNWPAAVNQLRNEMAGSVLAMHFMANDLSYAQTSAGRYYAMLIGRYDRFFGYTRRELASPAYDVGRGLQEDEVTKHMNNGTVDSYVRRARSIKKKHKDAHVLIGETGPMRGIIEKVCLYDRPILQVEVRTLVAGLELLAKLFGFNPAGELPKRDRVPHAGRRRN